MKRREDIKNIKKLKMSIFFFLRQSKFKRKKNYFCLRPLYYKYLQRIEYLDFRYVDSVRAKGKPCTNKEKYCHRYRFGTKQGNGYRDKCRIYLLTIM